MALDKSKGKISKLKELVDRYNLTNIEVFHADSSKVHSNDAGIINI